MPDYYKPQNLLDFEERLPSSDSLSLHSFNSTNLEWDDSAIAPSSEGKLLNMAASTSLELLSLSFFFLVSYCIFLILWLL